MTREDIIRMAREAGWSGLYTTYNEPTGAADWKMVKESLTVPVTMEQIERFAALVAAAEREACAKACEDAAIRLLSGKARINQVDRHVAAVLQYKAADIRARGNT